MNKIEEVKEILQTSMACYDSQLGLRYLTIDEATAKRIAQRICQLFEPKPGRLLSFEEVTQIYELWDMATNLMDIDPKESFSKTVGKFWSLIDFGMMVAVEQQELGC